MFDKTYHPPLWRSEAFPEDLQLPSARRPRAVTSLAAADGGPAPSPSIWRQPAWWRSLALAALLVLLGSLQAQAQAQAAAPDVASCRRMQPPADAGVAVTPGGFVLVHPRNADLPADYTGCRTLWVMQSEQHWPLLMRVHFRQGRAVAVDAYDGRGEAAAAAPRHCSIPSDQRGCTGVEQHPFVARQLPTWPRVCAQDAQQAVCQGDPQ